jgi:hypothetical protein
MSLYGNYISRQNQIGEAAFRRIETARPKTENEILQKLHVQGIQIHDVVKQGCTRMLLLAEADRDRSITGWTVLRCGTLP